jgi:hypothetical protein
MKAYTRSDSDFFSAPAQLMPRGQTQTYTDFHKHRFTFNDILDVFVQPRTVCEQSGRSSVRECVLEIDTKMVSGAKFY